MVYPIWLNQTLRASGLFLALRLRRNAKNNPPRSSGLYGSGALDLSPLWAVRTVTSAA